VTGTCKYVHVKYMDQLVVNPDPEYLKTSWKLSEKKKKKIPSCCLYMAG